MTLMTRVSSFAGANDFTELGNLTALGKIQLKKKS